MTNQIEEFYSGVKRKISLYTLLTIVMMLQGHVHRLGERKEFQEKSAKLTNMIYHNLVVGTSFTENLGSARSNTFNPSHLEDIYYHADITYGTRSFRRILAASRLFILTNSCMF